MDISLARSRFCIALLVLATAWPGAAAPTTPTAKPAAQAAPQPAAFAPAPAPAQPPKVWVEVDPKACHSNPWDHNSDIGGELGYFQTNGVRVYDNADISFDQLYDRPVSVCKDCACSAGFAMFLRVDEKDVPRLQPLGFKVSSVDPYNADTYVGSRRFASAAAPAAAQSAPASAKRVKKGAKKTKKSGKRKKRSSP